LVVRAKSEVSPNIVVPRKVLYGFISVLVTSIKEGEADIERLKVFIKLIVHRD
jgi:hypothetical protein